MNQSAELQTALGPVHDPAAQPDINAGKRLRLEDKLGAFVMLLLLVITLANVVVRYLTDISLAWTEEISVFLLVAMTLTGAAAAAVDDSHIRIEYFYMRGSARRRRTLMVLSAVAMVAMFSLLAVLITRQGILQFEYDETTPGLGVPRWWYAVWLPGLAALVAWRALIAGRRQLRESARSTVEGDSA